ncbi:MAG: ACT domain-containing protein [Hamadaea sp.]|uniref:glycine cleavage system protein R n=1 Tax=Hamadaea sp. TaxID=2024425 RepID=UPI00182E3E98|nr:ACT domain-containing protein [Hamadaea sp.]NUR52541.1 ACT domain-containing protein [Hamadaea sp.]NUR69797.1 ACT domain-containing protein [Hamadaea sp.]NUT17563.1 ACT domain-containing protein [Hamadaea sp.]
MSELAVTVLGHDRPGIVADVTGVLATLGANLTDSTMTRLRGHFAMTLICAGELSAAEVEDALRPLTADGRLTVGVRDVGADEESPAAGVPHLVHVHGADRLGIVAAVTRVLAEAGGNVTDLSTRLVGPLYVLVAEVELAKDSTEEVAARLAEVSESLGVEVTLRRAEADLL